MMQSEINMSGGYFGKYPGYRDFVQHGLDGSVVERVREWLSAVMDVGNERYEELWRDIYFQGPVWRFLLRDASLGEATWTGAVMPSMDARERYFPLVAVQRIDRPVTCSLFKELTGFLDQLETVMLATLQTPYPQVEDVRSHFDAFFSQAVLPKNAPTDKSLVVDNDRLSTQIDGFLAKRSFDFGIWQAVNVANNKPGLCVVDGFPGAAEFVEMLFETVALDDDQGAESDVVEGRDNNVPSKELEL